MRAIKKCEPTLESPHGIGTYMIVTASRRQIGLRRSVNLAYRRLCHGEQGIGTTAKGFFVVAKNQQNVLVQSVSKIRVSLRARELYKARSPPDEFSAEQ